MSQMNKIIRTNRLFISLHWWTWRQSYRSWDNYIAQAYIYD